MVANIETRLVSRTHFFFFTAVREEILLWITQQLCRKLDVSQTEKRHQNMALLKYAPSLIITPLTFNGRLLSPFYTWIKKF